ncbi:MAG: hypothetical protein ABI461_06770, partial [Polyangiaceae bacterium]
MLDPPASPASADTSATPSTGEPAAPAWTASPMSLSGSDLLPPQASRVPAGEDAALEARVSDLEARLRENETKMKSGDEQPWWVKHLTFTGYLQPQLLIQGFNAAASPNNQPTLPPGIGAND